MREGLSARIVWEGFPIRQPHIYATDADEVWCFARVPICLENYFIHVVLLSHP